MLRVVVPFIGGLLIGRSVAWSPAITAPLALVLWGAWVAVSWRWRTYRARWVSGALFWPLWVVVGTCWQGLHRPGARADDIGHWANVGRGWSSRVLELASLTGRAERAWVEVDGVVEEGAVHRASGRMLITLLADTPCAWPEVGDAVFFVAHADTIDRVADPGGFDLRQWAGGYGAAHTALVRRGGWRVLGRATGIPAWCTTMRTQVVGWLRASSLGPRERGLVKAILLGIRDELDTDQRDAFARSGTLHTLAVSGSHVALIYGALLWAMAGFGGRVVARAVRSILILLVLWAYAGMTGFTPSVMRATITFSLFCVADLSRRRTEPVNSLAAGAFVLLVWDPSTLLQLSFQLSFLAVLGIAMFYRPILHSWDPPNRVAGYFWSLFAVSMAAQAFTTPLSLLAFRAFPVWFLPANMVIVGLVALGVYGGVLLLALHDVPYVGGLLTWCMERLLWTLGSASELFAHLPGAYPSVRISGAQCIGLYVLVCLVALWWLERRRWARAGAAIVVVLLLVSWALAARARNTHVRFVVYDERRELRWAVEEGRGLVVCTDTVDAYFQRKVEQHRRSVGALQVMMERPFPRLLRPGGLSVLIWDGTTVDPRVTGRVDVLVIARAPGDPERLTGLLRPSAAVVLAPGLPRAERSRLVNWCRAHGVTVHDVRQDGAYVRPA